MEPKIKVDADNSLGCGLFLAVALTLFVLFSRGCISHTRSAYDHYLKAHYDYDAFLIDNPEETNDQSNP